MKKADQATIYKRLVEHMNEGVWMGDAKERTIYANPKFCSMMERTLEEMLGKESYEFWDKESAARVRDVNTHKRRKGESSSYEGNLLTKSGKRIPVLLSGTPLPDGGTIGIMTDLTELKKKEAKERLLTRAIQFANDAIVVLSSNGTIESWNKGAKLLFGYRQEEAYGMSVESIFPSQNVPEMLSRTQVRYNFELRGLHRRKQTVVVSATLSPMENDGSGKASSWLLIARDNTLQTKFEEELSLKYQKLREAYNQFGIVRRQMDYVFDMIDLSLAAQSNKHLGDFIVNAVIMLTKVDACVLRVHNPQKKSLDLLSHFGLTDDWRGKASIPVHRSLAQKAFEQGVALKIVDVTKEPRYHSAHLARKHNLFSMLMIPLTFHSQLIGSLSLYASPEQKLEIFENEFITEYAKIITLSLIVARGAS
jgi:PAS domain S-box-containing protein